jgi:hypothetical protein
MKPGPNYKMSSLTKMSLSGIRDPELRNGWKRMMIDAELSAAVQPKREKRPSGPGGYTKNPTGTASTRD